MKQKMDGRAGMTLNIWSIPIFFLLVPWSSR